MVSAAEPQTFFLPRQQLGRLVERLQDGGRQIIGPTVRDGAVMLDEIDTVEQLVNAERGDKVALRGPMGRGWPVELAEGRDVMVITALLQATTGSAA